MIGANADPACVLPQIVNSIGNIFLLPEIMYLDGFGLTLRPPFAAPILVVPYLFLLFRVYGNCRLATLQEFRRLRIDVFKLRIAVRMRGTLLRLAVRLQAVLLFVQQFRNQHMAHLVSLGAQFVGEIAHAFAGPPQRGLRIPSRHWFQQFFQIDAADPDLSAMPSCDRRPFAESAHASAVSDPAFFAIPTNPLRWLAWKRHWRAPPAICRPARGPRFPPPPITVACVHPTTPPTGRNAA